MPVIQLDVPESTYAQLRDVAQREGISINQFITTAVAEKLAALMTETYLAERASRGDRMAFERILAKVPSSEPEAADKL